MADASLFLAAILKCTPVDDSSRELSPILRPFYLSRGLIDPTSCKLAFFHVTVKIWKVLIVSCPIFRGRYNAIEKVSEEISTKKTFDNETYIKKANKN